MCLFYTEPKKEIGAAAETSIEAEEEKTKAEDIISDRGEGNFLQEGNFSANQCLIFCTPKDLPSDYIGDINKT